MASSLQPVCVPCGRVMKCSKTGRQVLELSELGDPLALHSGDEFECPACHTRVVAQFAARPVAEHYDARWPKLLDVREELARNPYRRWADAQHGNEFMPADEDRDHGRMRLSKLVEFESRVHKWAADDRQGYDAIIALLGEFGFLDDEDLDQVTGRRLQPGEPGYYEPEPRQREKGDDDGVEYADPRDRKAGLE